MTLVACYIWNYTVTLQHTYKACYSGVLLVKIVSKI